MFGWLDVGKSAGSIIEAITDGIDKLHTSDQEKLEAKQKLAELQQQPLLWQALQNRIEAQHRTTFVAGWRPFTGWICGFGLGYSVLGHPLLTWVLAVLAPGTEPPPNVGVEVLLPVLLGMLGLGAYRTKEKLSGVSP